MFITTTSLQASAADSMAGDATAAVEVMAEAAEAEMVEAVVD